MKKNFTLLLLTLTAAVIAAVFYASIAHGKVELRPSLSGKKLHAVLLGDSYSAGNGAGNYYGPDECYRSGNNWAHIYLNSLVDRGISLTFNNRACGGAVTSNILSDRQFKRELSFATFPLSTPRATIRHRLQRQCSTRFSDEMSGVLDIHSIQIGSNHNIGMRQNVSYSCTRTIKAQANFVGPQTDLVMFSIGGNDLEFKNIVESCFAFFAKDRNKCENAINYARKHLLTVKDNVRKVLKRLRANGLRKDAKIVIAGYPLLATASDYSLGGWPFSTAYYAAYEIRDLGRRGNAMLAQLVAEDNKSHPGQVIFINDIPLRFEGHEPDPSSKHRNPNRWLNEFMEPSGDVNEWYHPNTTGHHEYAKAVDAKLRKTDFEKQFKQIGGTSSDIDIVFNIDTTGSMGLKISSIKAHISMIVDDVKKQTNSARFAITSYRDDPARTNYPNDYRSRVDQEFTSDAAALKKSLENISADGGGDTPETMYSGIKSALELPWRPGVKKIVLTVTDAPALSPEPGTNLTEKEINTFAFAVDPAQLYVLADEYLEHDETIKPLVEKSGGAFINADDDNVNIAVTNAIQTAAAKPNAWINGPYVVKVGGTIRIDGSGSYATNGAIVSYEWDFNQDGVYDLKTTQPTFNHTFTTEFDGVLTLRVTDSNGKTNTATTLLTVSDDGDSTPREFDNCPDVYNYSQIDSDGDGIGNECDDTPFPFEWKFTDGDNAGYDETGGYETLALISKQGDHVTVQRKYVRADGSSEIRGKPYTTTLAGAEADAARIKTGGKEKIADTSTPTGAPKANENPVSKDVNNSRTRDSANTAQNYLLYIFGGIAAAIAGAAAIWIVKIYRKRQS